MGNTNSISLLWDITKIVNATNSLEQIFSEVAGHCASALKLDQIIIYSYDVHKQMMVQRAISIHSKNKFETIELNIPGSKMTMVDWKTFLVRKNYFQISVPVLSNGKLCGLINSKFSEESIENDGNELLFMIIASLLAPKLLEYQRPKREFESNNKYFRSLIHLMEKEKLYKDENLSLKRMADQLNLSTSYLSQIVNNLGEKSFSALVNEYRVREVVEAFMNGKHIRYSLLSIALDAGFSSKSNFNAVFKNVTGCSPSQYIREYV